MIRLISAFALAVCIGYADVNAPAHAQSDTPDMTDTAAPVSDDPRLYLEEVEGERALEQVRAWNTETLVGIEADPRFTAFRTDALGILNATDKIAYGQYRSGRVYNFWQDETNVRGVIRRTDLKSYLKPGENDWETLLDIDALAAREDQNWVFKGSTCLPPERTRCIIDLSDGGKDAVVRREWDHDDKAFVEGGFTLPEAKSRLTWADKDTLLVATDWGEGTLTESGYPFVIKRLERGQALEEAVEVLRGAPQDVAVMTFRLSTGEAEAALKFALVSHTFFERSYYWLPDGADPVVVPLPQKSSVTAYFKGQLLLTLEEDWTPAQGGETFAKGALVSFDFFDWAERRGAPNVQTVYVPGARASLAGVSKTQSKLLVSILDNVRGQVHAYDFVDGAWTSDPLDLPEFGALGVVSAYDDSDIVFINADGYLTPDSLIALNVATGQKLGELSLPNRFAVEGLTVQQFEATSTDGEKIPYFIVHQRDIALDGSNPTLLYGYGGFEIPMTPGYSPVMGKLWLENGGVYVVANIRGGGEFGPKWHQAALKTKRQVAFDDFIAVAEDLIARGVTSPRRLGISGGSNGGLLVGAAYTQRPELFNAVVCAVPLLDMLRYHLLLAGASWVGEYGDPDVPEERAFLESISPYHNVDAGGAYPEILFLTSTKDDRVHPAHARKMAALLAEYGHDFSYYENIDGGHSAAANLAEVAKRSAIQYVFLSQKLMD